MVVDSVNELWSHLKSFCQILEIDDEELFARQPTSEVKNLNSTVVESDRTSNDENRAEMLTEPKPKSNSLNVLPLTPQASSSASTSSSGSSTYSSCDNANQIDEGELAVGLKSISHKRRSTASLNPVQGNEEAAESEHNLNGQSSAKMLKIENNFSTLPSKYFC